MNVIIVDDEPLARAGIAALVGKHKGYKIIAECKNVLELQQALQQQKPDAIFLDIEMPHITGITFLETTQLDIPVIITTAYHEYALKSYELDVVDYLVKPIGQARFDKALEKLSEYISYKEYKSNQGNFIFLKCDRQVEKIFIDDILYVEAMRNYVLIHLRNKRLIHYSSIAAMCEKLDEKLFVRIHKSYIVALSKITNLTSVHANVGTVSLPISRNLKQDLQAQIAQLQSLK
jgi:two-component system, LytTR family, response regulator